MCNIWDSTPSHDAVAFVSNKIDGPLFQGVSGMIGRLTPVDLC